MKTKTTLLGLSLSGAAISLLVGLVGAWGLHNLNESIDDTAMVARAVQSASDMDLMHDVIRADVYSALLAAKNGNTNSVHAAQVGALEHAAELKGHLSDVLAQPLKPELLDQAQALVPLLDGYIGQAQTVTQKADADPQGADIGLAQFQHMFEALEVKLGALSDAIAAESANHASLGASKRTMAEQTILAVTLVSALILTAVALLVPRHLPRTTGGKTPAQTEHLQTLVHEMTDNTQQANRLVQEASNAAAQSGETVAKMVAAMNSINDASHKMLDIIQVIDTIAFQTHALALNTAEQAERGGDQDPGFALVAGEVRNLANRSAQVVKEISYLIDVNFAQVQHGTTLAKLASFNMTNVEGSIGQVRSVVGQINAASLKLQGPDTPIFHISEPLTVRNAPIGLPALT